MYAMPSPNHQDPATVTHYRTPRGYAAMPVIIDHAQQFSITNDDLRAVLARSEPGGKITTNGAQVSMGILISGPYARHAEVIANEHSEGAEIIRQHAAKG